MRVDGWFGEQTNPMIESFEISLREQKFDLPGSQLYLERSLTKFH